MPTIVEARPTGTYATPPLPKADSCVLVIFGATGDLTRRKLIPALFDLACEGCMPPTFRVLGIGRTAMADDDFRATMKEAMQAANGKDLAADQWTTFAA